MFVKTKQKVAWESDSILVFFVVCVIPTNDFNNKSVISISTLNSSKSTIISTIYSHD